MITLEQIQTLDEKVTAAVQVIRSLKVENASLQEKLDQYQNRIDELEVLINTFKKDQGKIEQGIINALEQLNELEDAIAEEASEPEPAVEEPVEVQEPVEETVEETPEITVQEPASTLESAESGEEDAEDTELDIF
jgi:chromosome segregation ATPase